MDRNHLTMILSSPYIDDVFKEKHSSPDDLPRYRTLEYIMTGGVRQEQERSFLAFVSDVTGVKNVFLAEQNCEESLMDVMSFKMAYAYKAAPLFLDQDILEVACLDPLDNEVVEDIEILTGRKCKSYLCGKYDLEQHLEHFYHKTWSDASVRVLEEERDIFQGIPDVFSVFLDIVSDAWKQGADTVFFQRGQRDLEIYYHIDGVSARAYVPLLLDTKYRTLVRILHSKKDRIIDFSPSSLLHFFIEEKPLAVKLSFTPTHRGDIIRLDILANKIKTLPDLSISVFNQKEREYLALFEKQEPSMLFMTSPDEQGPAFFLALSDFLAAKRRRGLIIEEEMVRKSEFLFHVSDKEVDFHNAGGLEDLLRASSPDFLAVRSQALIPYVQDFIRIACLMHFPVLFFLPFRETRDALNFLSQKQTEKNRISFFLLKTIGLMFVRSYRIVCPLCSVDRIMRPGESDFLSSIQEGTVKVKEARSCSSCHERGFFGHGFLAETAFWDQTGILREHKLCEAFEKSAARTSLHEKACESIIKKQTTIQEIERVLL